MNALKSICFVLLLLASSFVWAQNSTDVYLFSYFKNNGQDGLHLAYSLDGYEWSTLNNDRSLLTPTAGKDKLMRDPCIIQTPDGTFHMVWTVSWNEKGIGYASSKDLIHWSEQQYIPVMEHEKEARNTWAPEIFYDASRNQFMIFWASTITGRFTETQSTRENSYNHRIYYTTSKDLKMFSRAQLLYEPGFNVIDATIVKRNGRYIMFVKDETPEPPRKHIRIATSKKLTEGFSEAGPAITGSYWAEGPTVIQVGDQWVVYFDKYRDGKMGAVASADLNTWTDVSDKVRFPEGVRHGTVFKISKEKFEQLRSSLEKQQE
jgi:hypothetical protein